MPSRLESAQTALGHTFRDSRLLDDALTHGSVNHEAGKARWKTNQRLEFLGDAVLQLTLSEWLYERFPQEDEGGLTKRRAQIVSARALAGVARRLDLGLFLVLGRGEESHGGRERDNILADALESVLGAIHLDAGMQAARDWVRRHFGPEIEGAVQFCDDQNPKGRLQEICQSLGPVAPEYTILDASGFDHARTFSARVAWAGTPLGEGSGRSKREAETAAARHALDLPDLEARLRARAAAGLATSCEQLGQQADDGCVDRA
jgi:ribonuclease-3